MREHCIEVNDKARHHIGLQDIIVDNQEVPITFKRGLVHVPLREPTDENLHICPTLDITSDDPWYPQTVDDQGPSSNLFRGNSMHHNHVTKLGKIIGTEEKMDLEALVNAVKSAFQL